MHRRAAALLVGLFVVLAVPAAQAARPAAAPRQYTAVQIVPDARDSAGPLDISSAGFRQDGRDLVLTFRVRHRLAPRSLAQGGPGGVCALLGGLGGTRTEFCFNGTRSSLSAARLSPSGIAGRARHVPAAVAYSRRGAVARVGAGAGIEPGLLEGQFRSAWSRGAACQANPASCTDLAPDRSPVAFRFRDVRPIGCRVPSNRFIPNGPRHRQVIALTFDDGPSPYTSRVLSILEHEHVPATFFLTGRQVGPGARLARRELRDGDILGDHSWSHSNLAGGGPVAAREISSTKDAIRRATGFTTCLFRAPYGAVSSSLIAEAAGQSLATIQWDVDPMDWSLPGTGAVYSRIVGAVRSGSIVLMHDGGGPRGETVSALPRIIATLRAMGYSFATVPELLGGSTIYGP